MYEVTPVYILSVYSVCTSVILGGNDDLVDEESRFDPCTFNILKF